MTPAQRLAIIRAMLFGLGVAADREEQNVRAAMEATGADRFRTDAGTVGKTVRKPTIRFDDDQLLAFAEQVAPWEIERKVRPTFRAQFVIDGDAVIYKPTGEQVGFASVRPGTESITVRLTDEIKEHASEMIMNKIETVAGIMIESGRPPADHDHPAEAVDHDHVG